MGFILVPLLLISLQGACMTGLTVHREKLRMKYPYGLLGNDFGLLTEKDLASNVEEALPEPFSPESIAYPYWQCFAVKNVSFVCDHSGKQDPKEPIQALIVLIVTETKQNQEYLARRPWERDSCNNFEREWVRLTTEEEHICISGPFINNDYNEAGKTTAYWVFDKYKTRKGCGSYFQGECNLKPTSLKSFLKN